MAGAKDPTAAICEAARALPDVVEGASCNQTSFKAKKGAFLYIGPGPKGVGYKAMFKLDASRTKAGELAAEQPERFELGSGAWVVAWFTAAKPLAKTIWKKWLAESYGLVRGAAKGKSR